MIPESLAYLQIGDTVFSFKDLNGYKILDITEDHFIIELPIDKKPFPWNFDDMSFHIDHSRTIYSSVPKEFRHFKSGDHLYSKRSWGTIKYVFKHFTKTGLWVEYEDKGYIREGLWTFTAACDRIAWDLLEYRGHAIKPYTTWYTKNDLTTIGIISVEDNTVKAFLRSNRDIRYELTTEDFYKQFIPVDAPYNHPVKKSKSGLML